MFKLPSRFLSGLIMLVLSFLCTNLSANNCSTFPDGNNVSLPTEVTLACDRAADSLALVALYNATAGASWTTPWDLSKPLDQWFGITLTEGGCVARIILTDNGLVGQIPPEVGSISQLTSLYLNKNRLVGNIPPELGNLSRLRALVISQNDLEGPIPVELGQLTDLISLSLSSNNLTGNIPEELGELSSLYYLTLRINNLSGSIPPALGNLKQLIYLFLDVNELEGEIPSELGGLPKLRNFSLSKNHLTGPIPAEFGNLESLNYLSLHTNSLQGRIPASFGNLMNLETLHLHNNQLEGELLPELAGLPDLVELFLQNNHFSGCFPFEYSVFCPLGLSFDINNSQGYNFTGNVELPGSGNFEDFCNAGDGACVVSCSSLIWPADGSVDVAVGGNLSWSPVNINVLGYKIRMGTSPGGTDIINDLDVGNVNTYDPGDLPEETTLYVRIIPYNSDEEFTNCPEVQFTTGAKDCRTRDSLILVDLYNSTNGPEWRRPWDLSQPMDEWTGVILSLTGCVTDLHLYSNFMTGSIPASLGGLKKMKILDLHANTLSNPLPEELGNLKALKKLDIQSSQINGAIPITFGNLSSLETLILANNNDLTGEIPSELGQLSQLRQIKIHNTGISGELPTELKNLVLLEEIDLGYNNLEGTIPPGWGNLARLRVLKLGGNEFEGEIPSSFGNLSGLQVLHLQSNNLTGSIPVSLGNLTQLQELNLSTNLLEGPIPLALGNCVKLIDLTLTNNSLLGPIPASFGNLALLETLNMSDTEVTGTIPPELGNLENLIVLAIGNNNLEGSIPSTLGNLEKVEILVLQDNALTGSIPPEFGKLSHLRFLRLANNQLEGPLPPELGDLTQARGIWLHDNNLTGAIPESLGKLPGYGRLLRFHCQNNQLEGCFQVDLSPLCELGFAGNSGAEYGYYFTGNPNLPGGGDFEAFCNSGAGACPECTVLTQPVNGAENVSVETNLSWMAVDNASGYRLSLGTSPDGHELIDQLDVGNLTSYHPGTLPAGTTLYATLEPYNTDYSAIACIPESFTTTAPETPNCNVPDEHTLNDTQLASGIYQAQTSITSAGTVEGVDDVSFVAGNHIRLRPGFRVEAGAGFSARIASCEPLAARNSSNEDLAIMGAPASVAMDLKIMPNPVRSVTTIRFTLAEESEAKLLIQDLSGKIISRPLASHTLAAGSHDVILNANDLVAGIYLVTLAVKDEIARVKMVVVK